MNAKTKVVVLEKVKVWQSEDTRRDRDVIWFNALLRRK